MQLARAKIDIHGVLFHASSRKYSHTYYTQCFRIDEVDLEKNMLASVKTVDKVAYRVRADPGISPSLALNFSLSCM